MNRCNLTQKDIHHKGHNEHEEPMNHEDTKITT
jgi:hypothetical protein